MAKFLKYKCNFFFPENIEFIEAFYVFWSC